jgi:hypothetical protein
LSPSEKGSTLGDVFAHALAYIAFFVLTLGPNGHVHTVIHQSPGMVRVEIVGAPPAARLTARKSPQAAMRYLRHTPAAQWLG